MKLSLKSLSPRHRALQQAAVTLQRQRAIPLSLIRSPMPQSEPAKLAAPQPQAAPAEDTWFANAVAGYEARTAQAKAQAEVEARAAAIIAATRESQATSQPHQELAAVWGWTTGQVCCVAASLGGGVTAIAMGMAYLYRLIHGGH